MDILLALETSCDETTAAVIAGGRHILSNVVLTQEVLHQRFGGVVPELAAREHIRGIVPVVEQALRDAKVTWSDLAAVAVANGPGLAPALVVGVNMAKGIAFAHGLPLIAVNHLEGHIYANWLVKNRHPGADAPRPPELPAVGLVVSGGHTELVIMEDHLQYRLLGRTRDDAAGEAFDKVARLLGLGYPGGPLVERAARTATPEHHQPPLTRPWLRGTYDFSFSGVKTAMLRHVEAAGGTAALTPEMVSAYAAAFQQTVVDVLVGKTCQAADQFRARCILLAGGVAANGALRETLASAAAVPVQMPAIDLCTDNAAMIGAAGYRRWQAGHVADWDLEISPSAQLVSAS